MRLQNDENSRYLTVSRTCNDRDGARGSARPRQIKCYHPCCLGALNGTSKNRSNSWSVLSESQSQGVANSFPCCTRSL
jgi:hypothetical protein